jgi:hypothetical protein
MFGGDVVHIVSDPNVRPNFRKQECGLLHGRKQNAIARGAAEGIVLDLLINIDCVAWLPGRGAND